ncbi:hypothetical protein AX774_g7447 [Zancudomyces culisetae]|uniref:Carbohydrate-binding module family 19 domain-containing protein n=1 Tax=Zancudomyces culisetae TaxID=1213189 RepID=A0A1R1PDY2_ZANCU|nr:hypothetical protein AX774_g7447 [Zancudomyces culisetae]|eukprot:OMH79161.1 hypothetical protein AX774_g7447 [Zancudomyces culisetae]
MVKVNSGIVLALIGFTNAVLSGSVKNNKRGEEEKSYVPESDGNKVEYQPQQYDNGHAQDYKNEEKDGDDKYDDKKDNDYKEDGHDGDDGNENKEVYKRGEYRQNDDKHRHHDNKHRHHKHRPHHNDRHRHKEEHKHREKHIVNPKYYKRGEYDNNNYDNNNDYDYNNNQQNYNVDYNNNNNNNNYGGYDNGSWGHGRCWGDSYRCIGKNKGVYLQCDHNRWIVRPCGPGTVCVQNGYKSIYCGYPSPWY